MKGIRRTVGQALLASLALAGPAEAQTPYEELVPGRWAVVSLNTLADLDPCPERDCSYSAVEGVYAVMNDWCGGAFASGYGTLGGLVAWGGGHNGYFGSEIYVFDLAAHTWVRVTDPFDDGSASVAARCSQDGVYPDGSACPTHTYNSIEYHPGTNSLVILNGTPDPVAGGAYDGRAHLFDFTSGTWRLGTRNEAPFGYDAPGVYDARRDLFWQLYGYVYHLTSYDPDLDQWTDHGIPGTFDIDGTGRIDPIRDLFLFLDGRGSGRLYALPLATPDTTFVELTTAGDTEIQTRSSLGFDWDPTRERFVAWDDGADVYVLTPPVGDWRTGTWTWSRVPPDPGNTVIPARNPNGTYGRFRYAQSIHAFILVSTVDGPVWAYRLPDGACADQDGDGYGDPASAACAHPELDCADGDPAVHPGRSEDCNQVDDDCDGTTDVGCDCADCDAPEESCGCGSDPGSAWAVAVLSAGLALALQKRRSRSATHTQPAGKPKRSSSRSSEVSPGRGR